jgi:hypothetical protein
VCTGAAGASNVGNIVREMPRRSAPEQEPDDDEEKNEAAEADADPH